MQVQFNVTGAERKKLVSAISEILNAPASYLGAPSFGYKVGGYTVGRNGTLSGERSDALLGALAECSFEAEEAADTAMPETAKGSGASDRLTIEIPADGFTPEKLENLTKLVESKAALIKTALGEDDLPIESTGDTLRFPWFSGDFDGDTVMACVQFIAALCKTAKEKKRVTAKARDEFENPRFAMRVWLIGLGMAGDDFKPARKFLLKNLTGNAAWRYGAPKKKAAGEAADGADAGTKTTTARLPPRREKKPLPAIRARAAPEKRTKSGEIVLNTIFARESMIAPARFPFSGGWEPLSVVFRAVAGWQRRLLAPI